LVMFAFGIPGDDPGGVADDGGAIGHRFRSPACVHPLPCHSMLWRRNSELRMSDQEFSKFEQSLVQHAPDAIIYADAEGYIRYWNTGAERIFGFQAREAVGQMLDIIIPESLRVRHWHGYHTVMKTGQSRYAADRLLSVPAIRKDGKRI